MSSSGSERKAETLDINAQKRHLEYERYHIVHPILEAFLKFIVKFTNKKDEDEFFRSILKTRSDISKTPKSHAKKDVKGSAEEFLDYSRGTDYDSLRVAFNKLQKIIQDDLVADEKLRPFKESFWHDMVKSHLQYGMGRGGGSEFLQGYDYTAEILGDTYSLLAESLDTTKKLASAQAKMKKMDPPPQQMTIHIPGLLDVIKGSKISLSSEAKESIADVKPELDKIKALFASRDKILLEMYKIKCLEDGYPKAMELINKLLKDCVDGIGRHLTTTQKTLLGGEKRLHGTYLDIRDVLNGIITPEIRKQLNWKPNSVLRPGEEPKFQTVVLLARDKAKDIRLWRIGKVSVPNDVATEANELYEEYKKDQSALVHRLYKIIIAVDELPEHERLPKLIALLQPLKTVLGRLDADKQLEAKKDARPDV